MRLKLHELIRCPQIIFFSVLGVRWKIAAAMVAVFGLWFVTDSVLVAIQEQSVYGLQRLSLKTANDVRLSVDSFDPDQLQVKVTATSKPEVDLAPSDVAFSNRGLLVNLKEKDLLGSLRYGELHLQDLSPLFNFNGLKLTQFSFGGKFPTCSESNPTALEQESAEVWKVLEMPLWSNSIFSDMKGVKAYPFDEYLLVGGASRNANFCYRNGNYPISSELDIVTNLPGFSLSAATPVEMENWPTLINSSVTPNQEEKPSWVTKALAPIPYDYKLWHTSQVAMVIRRPVALRRMAILLVTITAFATLFLAITCPNSSIPQNFAGSLFTIWTVRGLVSVNAPKSPTLIDFFSMLLFTVLALVYVTRPLWRRGEGATSENRLSQIN